MDEVKPPTFDSTKHVSLRALWNKLNNMFTDDRNFGYAWMFGFVKTQTVTFFAVLKPPGQRSWSTETFRCVTVEDAGRLEGAFKANYSEWKAREDAHRARQKRINAEHFRRVRQWENRNDERAKRMIYWRRRDSLISGQRSVIRSLKSRLQSMTQGAWSTYNDSVNSAMKGIRDGIQLRIDTATNDYKNGVEAAEESHALQMAALREEAEEAGVTI